MTRRWPWRFPVPCGLATAFALVAFGAACAQPAQSTDAGGGAGLRDFCADRPTQSSQPCTVDKGHFQLESDIFNGTYDRSGGVITDTYLFTSPTLKYGLTSSSDIEVQLAPYEEVRTHDPSTGATDALYGVGDLFLRFKQSLLGEGDAPLQLALDPFVKAPRARAGIGDGAWEGGLPILLDAKVTKTLDLVLNAEVDVLKDMRGGGVHPSEVEIACLNWQATKKLTASIEAYAREDQDPMGVTTQTTGDLALAYMLTDDIQLDVGVNIGLNPQTAAFQSYTGISKRF